MITMITSIEHDDCWKLCNIGQHAKDCAWISYSSTDKLCYLWSNCAKKISESPWISSNKDCYNPDSKALIQS